MEQNKDKVIENLQETINNLTRQMKTCKNEKDKIVKHSHDRERRMRASFSKQLADMNIRKNDLADRLNVNRNKFMQEMEQLLVKERQETVAFSEESDQLILRCQSLQRANDIIINDNAKLQDFIKKINSK